MDYRPASPTPPPASVQPSHSFVDRIIGAVKLSRPIYDEVRRDPSAMMQAAGIVVVTGLLSGISQGAEIRGQNIDFGDDAYQVTDSVLLPLVSGITVAVLALVFWIIAAIIYRFVAVRILNSPETGIQWQEVARPLGFASAPSLLLILTPIPVLGFIVGSLLWILTFAAQIVAMSETFRVSKKRSFAILIVAAIGLALVLSLIVCGFAIIASALF